VNTLEAIQWFGCSALVCGIGLVILLATLRDAGCAEALFSRAPDGACSHSDQPLVRSLRPARAGAGVAPIGTLEVVACPTPAEHHAPPPSLARRLPDGPWRPVLPLPPAPAELGNEPLEVGDGQPHVATTFLVAPDGSVHVDVRCVPPVRYGLGSLAGLLALWLGVGAPLSELRRARRIRASGKEPPDVLGGIGCSLAVALVVGFVAARCWAVDAVVVPPRGADGVGRLEATSTYFGALTLGGEVAPVNGLAVLHRSRWVTAFVGPPDDLEQLRLFDLDDEAKAGVLRPVLDNLFGPEPDSVPGG
jgi:hypothetical protein